MSLLNELVGSTDANVSTDALGAGGLLAVADGGVGAARAKGTNRIGMIWDPRIFDWCFKW